MQHRGQRLAILCLILLTGALAGVFIWTTERGVRQLDEQRESKEATIDRLQSSISTIASTQQAYAENRRHDVASFTRVSVLVNRITTDAAGLRAAATSGASNERLEEFWTALSALMAAESRARGQFAGGDEGAAAETMLASAHEHVTRLNSSLRAFREAEVAIYRSARATSTWQSAAVLGISAVLWAAGLVMFAVVPWRATTQVTDVAASTPGYRNASTAFLRSDVMSAETAPQTAVAPPAIDLAAAARLTTELSTLSDQAQLPGLLGRAADVLDARGVVIWMGAGSELFAAAAHGYDPAVLQRIKPIARSADNATAAAWRTSQMRTVPADSDGHGAIVAPMLGPAGCVGVLAAETRSGREQDEATQSVATIVASQLASVLAAWPAASTTAAEPLDRKAAAS
jgi:GAF domain-containing protein